MSISTASSPEEHPVGGVGVGGVGVGGVGVGGVGVGGVGESLQ
jgi:hypothetical protein